MGDTAVLQIGQSHRLAEQVDADSEHSPSGRDYVHLHARPSRPAGLAVTWLRRRGSEFLDRAGVDQIAGDFRYRGGCEPGQLGDIRARQRAVQNDDSQDGTAVVTTDVSSISKV